MVFANPFLVYIFFLITKNRNLMKILHQLKSMKNVVRKSSLVFSMVFAFSVCFSALSLQAQTFSEVSNDLKEQFYSLVHDLKVDLELKNENTQSASLQYDNETIIIYFNYVLDAVKSESMTVQDAFHDLSALFIRRDAASSFSSPLAGNLFEQGSQAGSSSSSSLASSANSNPFGRTQLVPTRDFKIMLDAVHLNSTDGLDTIKGLYYFILENR